MKVVSLFDGMSCGRVALERAGKPVTSYIASEIDKHAISIAQKNYPTTIQLGDVRAVRQMAQYGLLGHVDLLIGGSPCQGFSFAGKQLAFDDPRSVLFFEFVWTLQALRAINPNIKFLLENVKMKKEHLAVISDLLGVQPVCINSALVSAQNRVRYYWANWAITQPLDGGVFLRDIIESDPVGQEYEIGPGQLNRLKNSTDVAKGFSKIDPEKAGCMTARQYANWKGNEVSLPIENTDPRALMGVSVTENGIRPYKNDGRKGSFSEIGTIGTPDTKSACLTSANTPKIMTDRHLKNIRELDEKAQCLISTMHKGAQANGMTLVPVGIAQRGRGVNPETGGRDNSFPPQQQIEIREDGKANCLTTKTKDSMVGFHGAAFRRRADNLEIRKDEKSNCLLGEGHQSRFLSDGIRYRKLTPVECERLQTLPDNYTAGVSDSQRYKMLGNGWNVETIAHIFRCME